MNNNFNNLSQIAVTQATPTPVTYNNSDQQSMPNNNGVFVPSNTNNYQQCDISNNIPNNQYQCTSTNNNVTFHQQNNTSNKILLIVIFNNPHPTTLHLRNFTTIKIHIIYLNIMFLLCLTHLA
jgi:hypothetical protein